MAVDVLGNMGIIIMMNIACVAIKPLKHLHTFCEENIKIRRLSRKWQKNQHFSINLLFGLCLMPIDSKIDILIHLLMPIFLKVQFLLI